MTFQRRVVLAAVLAIAGAWVAGDARSAEDGCDWRAGVASVKITPNRPMWMAGYAARDKPFEDVAQDLFAKALALEDSAGTRLVLVTLDLIGVPRKLRDSLEAKIGEAYSLPPESLLLSASHTHSGPEVRLSKASMYGFTEERIITAEQYVARLEEQIVAIVGEALERLEPARLAYSHARAGFAMNRRLPTENGYRNRPNPDGPVDHDVPVLRVTDAEGKLLAVVFGYACHNTTLGFYRITGDYAGYAQEYLEAAHPGTTALFVTGCGADQNPYPRRTFELAQQHGRALANAVEAALEVEPRPVHGPLRVALEDVVLEFAPPPKREELLRMQKEGDKWDQRRAAALLEQLDRDGVINTEYPYPVQVAQFGDDLTLIALAGEVVVDYSLRLKRELGGSSVWVAGYSNDVFGYLPSLRVLNEGGYEAGGATRYSTLPGPFAPSVEDRVMGKVYELLRKVGGPKPAVLSESVRSPSNTGSNP